MENNDGNGNPGKQKKRGSPTTQWKKGVSGNPSGRPKSAPSFTAVVRARLQSRLAGGDRTAMDQLADRYIELAMGGNTRAAEILLDRLDPKPKQTSDITINNITPQQSLAYLDRVRANRLALLEAGENENGQVH